MYIITSWYNNLLRLLILYFNLFEIIVNSNIVYNIPPYERQALYDLYNTTNGDHWIYQEGNQGLWDFTDPNVNPCLPNNTWQGLNCTIITSITSSMSLDGFYYISKIVLPKYNLNGYIPVTIGNFSQLQYLDLSYNHLHNYIPYTIGNLTSLLKLDLSFNAISGTLPPSLYDLAELQILNMDTNYNIKGTISNKIDQLSQLQYLNFRINHFTGSIPINIGNLTKLTYLRLSGNDLTGSIPYSICNLTSLTLLILAVNQLTGTFPHWIGTLSLLTELSLNYNYLTGAIPTSLSNLTLLTLLYISDNYFTNHLPTNLNNLVSLTTLRIGNNYLSGTISPTFSRFISLAIFDLSYNHFSGSFPNWLYELPSLVYLDLAFNRLTNTLPTCISYITITNNTTTTTTSNLSWLAFSGNLLTGTIPNIFDQLLQLTTLLAEENQFTGTIPTTISTLISLRTLFLQNNHFTGNLDKVFNGAIQKQLHYIQLSNNQLTGLLPMQVFNSHNLIVFSAVSNCFHGSIPASICMNNQLKAIALDGLVCASSCRNKIIPGLSNAYLSEKTISGGIPNCLWSMPKLLVLHLSGNSLTGSLADNINISTSLIDLSLSYNLLTGSIPSTIHDRVWTNIDLSHNRISGTIPTTTNNYASSSAASSVRSSTSSSVSSNASTPTPTNKYASSSATSSASTSIATQKYASTNTSISFNNNRISGYIPSNLMEIKDINILEGNYFDCKYDRSDLPTHDDSKDTYECGSKLFNVLYYLWLGITATIAILVLLVWYYKDKLDNYFQVSVTFEKIWNWLYVMEYLEKQHCVDETLIIVLKQIRSMQYYHQYENINKMILLFSMYCTLFILFLLLPVYVILSVYYGTHTYEYAWTVSISFLSGKVAFSIIMSLLLVFVIMQICIYIYSIRNNSYHFTLNFKEQLKNDREDGIIYNKDNKCRINLVYLSYILINLIIVGSANIIYVYIALYQSNSIVILAQILLSIFKLTWNNIISPKMVCGIVKNLSLLHINQNRIIYRGLFILQFAVSLFNNIIIPCLIVSIISPNCLYHIFQEETSKTSSFSYIDCAIYYSDNKCYKYKEYTSIASYSPPFTYSYQCSSNFITYYAPVFIFICIISTFYIPIIDIIIRKLISRYQWLVNLHELPRLISLDNNKVSNNHHTILMNIDDIYEYLVSELTLVALLLTFGTVFPPLAIALLITICRRMLYHKAIIGRYILSAITSKSYHFIDIIEEDCKVIPLLLTIQQCGLLLIYTSCMFYTLFLFDILGDDLGAKKAYWVLIVMPCVPITIHGIYRLFMYTYRKKLFYNNHNNTTNDTNNNELELITSFNITTNTDMIINPLAITIISIDQEYNNYNNNNNNTNNTINNYNENDIQDIDVLDREGKSIVSLEYN